MFFGAYVFRMPGLRHVARASGIDCFSSLSHALSRPSSLAFISRLLGRFSGLYRPRRLSLVALDSMPVSLPDSQRHNCPKLNNQTAGCGILWAFDLDCPKGQCPVQVLGHATKGGWIDSVLMREVELEPNGPVYLMDAGFRSYDLCDKWLNQAVNFIMRLPYSGLRYEVIRPLSKPRGNIALDAIVRLGAQSRRGKRPIVRLVIVRHEKKKIVLVTGLFSWPAKKVSDSYKRRWEIEGIHKVLKDTIGLAHLYNFRLEGILFLTYCALLLAVLLFLSEDKISSETLPTIFRSCIQKLRRELLIPDLWKRNTVTKHYRKRRRTHANL